MKTLDALKKRKKSLKLKIGAKNCFFYVGTVGDILENHELRDNKMRSLLRGLTTERRKTLKTRCSLPPTIGEFIAYEAKKDRDERDFSEENFKRYVDDWVRVTLNMVKQLDRAADNEAAYIPIAERKVKECKLCDGLVDEDCLRMIVEGTENGKYWTTDEARGCAVGISGGEYDDETMAETGAGD